MNGKHTSTAAIMLARVGGLKQQTNFASCLCRVETPDSTGNSGIQNSGDSRDANSDLQQDRSVSFEVKGQ